MSLRELDDRFVSAASARLRRWAEPRTPTRRPVAPRQPAKTRLQLPSERLAQLDARYASGGPLAAVREVPQLGFIAIAVVFMAGMATAVVRSQPAAEQQRPAATAPFGRPDVPAGSMLGPDIGQSTQDYEKLSHADLERVAANSPDSRRLALIAFSDYRTPAQVTQLLAGMDVRRVYLRASKAGPEAAQVPYDIHGELGASLRRAYADIALSRLELRRSYLAYVATTQNDKAYHDDYQHYADAAGREVAEYQHGCACVFNVVVEAPARVLLALWTDLDIRSVQVAASGASMGALLVTPLTPETTGVVTQGPPTPTPAP